VLKYRYFAAMIALARWASAASTERYLPRRVGPVTTIADAGEEIQELIRKVLATEPVSAAHKRLILSGATMSGARPKALLNLDGEQWVVKFSDGEPTDTPLVEHASITLASKAKVRVAKTMPVRLMLGHALVDRWRHHFKTCGVSRGDIESYAEQIDRVSSAPACSLFRFLKARDLVCVDTLDHPVV
jgi:serine/threonine-protein kinase HipA